MIICRGGGGFRLKQHRFRKVSDTLNFDHDDNHDDDDVHDDDVHDDDVSDDDVQDDDVHDDGVHDDDGKQWLRWIFR